VNVTLSLASSAFAQHDWTGASIDFVDELAMLGRRVPALFEPDRPDPLRLWLFTAGKPE
jgi:hypothetical protein